MKALLRLGVVFAGLFVVASISPAYVLVSPVFKQPYPRAPDAYTSAFFLLVPWGRVTGPHYYFVPPFQPFQMPLPGPTGHGIQTGTLSHSFLMSKQGLTLGNVPLLADRKHQG